LAGLALAGACSESSVVAPPAAAPPAVAADGGAALAAGGTIQAGGTLVNGQNHAGSITAAGQTDTWTFAATQGQLIAVAIGEVSGTPDFTPWIRLVDPNGNTIANTWNAAAAQIQVAAPVTGTYQVLAATADAGNDATGNYLLTLALIAGTPVVPSGDQGGPMTNGAIHTGSIHVGDLDQWTFTANQGDYIAVAIGEITGTVDYTPWIRLVAPNGSVVGNTWNAGAAQIGVNASITGQYTIIVSTADAGNDATGDYRINVLRSGAAVTVSPGDQGGPMTNGAIHTGTILTGDLDIYTFSANQGELIAVAVGEITGTADYTPWIRLIAPNGALVANTWNAAAAQVQVNASLTGTYTVILSTADAGNEATGDYRVNLVRAPGTPTVSPGDEGGPATNGAIHTGTVDVGDLDVYTFTTNQGNPFAVSIGEITGTADFTPWIRVVAPNGAVVGNTWNAAAAQVSAIAQVSGTFTVIVSTADAGNDATGDYRINIHKGGAFTTSPGDQGGVIANGANATGTIVVGDIDRFTFTANQGDYIAVAVGEVSGTADFTPWIRLAAPTGQIVGNTWNAAAAQLGVVAPATGTYTVVIGTADSGNDATGDFTLTVVTAPGTFTVPAGDQGGTIHNGTVNGSIFTGDLDPWRFTANQGAAVSLVLTELSGTADYTPWIRVVGPNGALVANTWGAAGATVNFTASLTGAYTVILSTADSGNDATGSYRLQTTGVNVVSPPDVVSGGAGQ
jgi:hypothetical protein